MALFNYATKEITLKIVYYGPGLSGKTTNIQHLHSALNPENKGKLLSLATESDRTLFFDFLPVELGKIRDFSIRFQLYTVPGQVRYNATRKVVLKGADAVVFVADSQRDMRDQNIESFENMRENLISNNINPDEIPLVMQYNKRDLTNILAIDELNDDINKNSIRDVMEAEAVNGKGVEDTFQLITRLALKDIARKHKIEIQPALVKEEVRPAEETLRMPEPETAVPAIGPEAERIEPPVAMVVEEPEPGEPEYELGDVFDELGADETESEQEPERETEHRLSAEYEPEREAYREPAEETQESVEMPPLPGDLTDILAADISRLNTMLSDVQRAVSLLKEDMLEIKNNLNSLRENSVFGEDKLIRELRNEQGTIGSLKADMLEIKSNVNSIRESTVASGDDKRITELRRDHQELHKILKDVIIILKSLKVKKSWFRF